MASISQEPPSPSTDISDDTPSSSPAPEVINKFNWLKQSRNARNNPFVKSRPSLTRESSTAELFSRENSSQDFFQNSRLNLFETAPKPENSQGYKKGVSFIGWHQRTKLERVLLVCCAVLLLATLLTTCILLLVRSPSYLPVPPCYRPEPAESNVCLSSSCIYTASEVIRALDETQNPCDDFYEFACGGWIRNNPIPEGKSSWGIFSKIELQNQLTIRYALEKVNISEASGAEAKARIYYDACIDTNETIEKLGEKPLIGVIKQLGGWHLLPNTVTKQQKWDLQKLMQDVQNTYNLGGLFNWAVSEDDRNSSKHVIVLDQGGLNLPTRDNYLNKTAHKKVLDAYLDYMTKISVLLGANKSEARAQMNKVIQFETELANITTPSEDRRDEESLYNPYTLKEWQKVAPFLNWSMFFNDAFKLVNRTVSDNERLVVYAPEYFKNLTRVIRKYSKTEEDQKTITSYMMWQVSRSLSTYLSKSFRDATKILRKALFGSEGTEESWRYCVTDTNNAIVDNDEFSYEGFAVGAMFVREVFHGEAKTQGEIMIDHIRTAFKENLKNLDWMDAETRQAAEIKADAITDMIGFPDYILNKEELDKQYSDLEVKPNQYFENNIAFNVYTLRHDLKKLDQPVNKTKWGENIADNGGLKASFHAYLDYSKNAKVNYTLPGLKYNHRQLFFISFAQSKSVVGSGVKHLTCNLQVLGMTPSTVNAYYTPTKNQIVFPAGILQLPFYDGDNPKSVNYGAMGVVMGHELTHAFDDQGREYDRFGNLNQWWNNATIGRFKKRAKCIQEQYSNYTMEGLYLNGKQTLGENIADNGGLKASFHAYLDYSKNAKVNYTLPGLKYNHRQLFFISFAQVWCSSMTKESTKMQIEKDDHTVAKYRVIGPISNLKEFSQEFNCSVKSNMNPEHKCEVW
ncbi:Endothelin-converting enzyme 1 [Papilio machaon]|uniref:Endothelin-converting enzyme 1 n=1 Tax=Papilio machaon TaxID=76193 RepID=A0A0N1PJA9_PAPMA|nr:Endothelin-converting enzyme 1 [Papilio machaon]